MDQTDSSICAWRVWQVRN